MIRRLSAEKQFELHRLRRVLRVFGAFMDRVMSEERRQIGSFSATIEKAADAGDLPGLRMALGDMIGMLEAASVSQRRELDAQLRSEAATSLSSLMTQQFARVAKLRKRGKLTSEQQYYLVREHVEFIAHDPEHAATVPELEAMMLEYEQRIARRRSAV